MHARTPIQEEGSVCPSRGLDPEVMLRAVGAQVTRNIGHHLVKLDLPALAPQHPACARM